MYTYYKQVIDKEHCLLQNELAQISGFVSGGDNPHTQLIGAALKEYIIANKIEPLYFYSGQHRKLLSVFPQAVYKPVLEALYAKVGNNSRGKIEIGGKTYAYTLIHRAILGGVA
jgi:hypothetical protein